MAPRALRILDMEDPDFSPENVCLLNESCWCFLTYYQGLFDLCNQLHPEIDCLSLSDLPPYS